MPISKANSARLSCALVVALIVLVLLIIIAAISAIAYWVYLHFGLVWAIVTGSLIIVTLLLLNYRSRKRRISNADLKVYVEVNPQVQKESKEFVKALRKKQKNEEIGEQLKLIRYKLNDLIESPTQTRYYFLTYDKDYLDPDLLKELDKYIDTAGRNGYLLCTEELRNLKNLIEQCKQEGTVNAFSELGLRVQENVVRTAATGIQSILFIEYIKKSRKTPKLDDKVSKAIIQAFHCEKCKQYFYDDVWLLIDIYERPDLFAQLPQIHSFECPYCGNQIRLEDHAIMVHFYSDRIPPMIIYTNDEMKLNSQNYQAIVSVMDEKLPDVSKSFAGDSPLAKKAILSTWYGPVHPLIGAIDLIHEAREPMIEFAKTYPREFTDWLFNVLLIHKDLDTAILFYSGVKHDLSDLYKYREGEREVGREIIDSALHRLFENPQSITLKVISFLNPIVGALVGVSLLGKISTNPGFWEWVRNGLYSGALFGLVLGLLLVSVSSIVMPVESKIRRIKLPTLKPGIEMFFYPILIALLGGIIGLMLNLLLMGVFSILARWVSINIFTSVSGALLGLLFGLQLNNPKSEFEVIFFARYANRIFLDQA